VDVIAERTDAVDRAGIAAFRSSMSTQPARQLILGVRQEVRMAVEDQFLDEAEKAAREILAEPLLVRRGAPLLYQVTVNNLLELTVKPKRPVRGQSAFQTDLSVFERVSNGAEIPRVVLEFKPGVTTHDVLTYSTKARKHKQVYPYLRYGLIIGNDKSIPGRFFTHNEALDFCAAAASFKQARVHELFASLLRSEVEASRRLERIIFGKESVHLFRQEIHFESGGSKVV
jgi:hypothetical protein